MARVTLQEWLESRDGNHYGGPFFWSQNRRYFRVYSNPGGRFVVTYEDLARNLLWVKCTPIEDVGFSTVHDEEGLRVLLRRFTATRQEVVRQWQMFVSGKELPRFGDWYTGNPWIYHYAHFLNDGAALAIELSNICRFEKDSQYMDASDWPQFLFGRLDDIEKHPFDSVSTNPDWDESLDYWYVKGILAVRNLAQFFNNHHADELRRCFLDHWKRGVETPDKRHEDPLYFGVWQALLLSPIHLSQLNHAVLWISLKRTWNSDSGALLRMACDGLRAASYFDIEAQRRIMVEDPLFEAKQLKWIGIIDLLRHFEEWENLGYCLAIGREAGYEQ